LAGAPLDAIKTAAALLMVVDHANTVLFEGAYPWMWRLGRIAYPLFAFALAVQVLRRADRGSAVATLLLAAVAAQPFYAAAFAYGTREANILFTLAAGSVLAQALLRACDPWRHGVLAAGFGATLLLPGWTLTGVDFGLGGVMLPAALALALARPRSFLPWLPVALFALNWATWKPPGETRLLGAGLDALAALAGGAVVVALCGRLAGRRFLPRYALHGFYPGHLGALALLRWLGRGG
jgi:hypothetical protein